MQLRYVQFLVILQCLPFSYCANILIADYMPSPSHQIFNYAIAEALVERGYNVTVLGPPSSKKIVHENYHHLSLEDLFSSVMKDIDGRTLGEMSNLQMILFFHDYAISACRYSLQSKGFKQLMDYPKDFEFDLILFDITIGNCFLPLIQRFNYPPAVGVTAFLIPPFLSFDFGNDMSLPYIPSFYTPYSTDMSFLQRLDNYICTYAHIILREIYVKGTLKKIVTEGFNGPVDSLDRLENHVSLLLVNWNPVLHHPQGVTPNIIPIGGSHINPKKLPKDLQDIMDNAPHGVILFSLGTNIRSDDFNDVQRNIILNTFSKLKETVLWKFESNITGLSKNVIVRKWLPQTEILAHPNLKLFISHGGGLSTVEASHFGVPVLGIPFFVDQHLNVDNLVRKGVAQKLNLAELTESNFLKKINEIIHTDKYITNMKELSRKIRDAPQTPMERAIFWIEYAIRYNGTHFLNPKSRYLSVFINSSTDIHLFIISVVCLFIYILYIFYKVGKNVICKIFKKETKPKKE